MRFWIAILVLATTVFAQHRGGFGRGGFGRGGGFGRPGVIGGMRPGFGHAKFGHGGFRFGFHGGFFRGGFGRSGFGFHSGFGRGSFFPFYSGFPIYAPVVPDWYAAAPPAIVIITQPRDDPPPSRGPVIINNTPVIPWRQQDYRAERDSSNSEGPIVYLIALKDGAIWAAVAYWVDGSTLYLVTRRKEQMTFPLDEVDRGFSERLNRERRVQFRLP